MGYLYLAIALFMGASKGYCGKKLSGYVKSNKDTMLFNFIRMVFCVLIGAGMLLFNKTAGASDFFDWKTVLISALSGISSAAFVVLWIISVQNGAYVMLDVFLMLGVGVTIAGCRIFFNEAIYFHQLIGFVFLIFAAYIMSSYNKSIKGKFTLKSLFLLILCGLSNGLTDFSQKLYIYTVEKSNIALFNLYTYFFAAIVLLIAFLFFKKEEGSGFYKNSMKTVFFYIFVMSVCLFLCSYFQTLAAKYLDASVLYPLNRGIALMLSALMASVFFKEKITKKCIIGMVVAFISIMVINM